MSKVHGYIELHPSVIIPACQAYLRNKEERREKARQDFIKGQMTRKWFPAKTEEAAEKRAWDGVYGCAYSIGGGYWEAVVRSVLQQAKTADKCGTTVFISDDAHDCIGQFIKPKKKVRK